MLVTETSRFSSEF